MSWNQPSGQAVGSWPCPILFSSEDSAYHERPFQCVSSWYCFWPGKTPLPKIVNNSSKRYQFPSQHLRLTSLSQHLSRKSAFSPSSSPAPLSFLLLQHTKRQLRKKYTNALSFQETRCPRTRWGKGRSAGVGGHKIGSCCGGT